jgi:hypothetical protein
VAQRREAGGDGVKRLALLLVIGAASPLGAQIPNGMEGEAMVGITGQNDTQKRDRVQLSGVGLSVGFIAQPIAGHRRLSIANQLAFYPSFNYDKPVPFDTLAPPNTSPLVLNTTWVRIGSGEPEGDGHNVYFAGAGLGLSVFTPRSGNKVSPMGGVGMRRWFGRQMGFEVSLQCSVLRLGRTWCQLPVTSLWPFHGTKA